MNICLYDLFFNEKNGLPELREVQSLDRKGNREYSRDEIVDLLNECISFCDMRNEHSYVVVMNFANHIKGIGILAIGNNEQVYVDTKTLGAYLLLLGADKFITFHNHPSRILEPSENDIKDCALLQGMSALWNIEMEDDIIVTQDGWYGIISKVCVQNK